MTLIVEITILSSDLLWNIVINSIFFIGYHYDNSQELQLEKLYDYMIELVTPLITLRVRESVNQL